MLLVLQIGTDLGAAQLVEALDDALDVAAVLVGDRAGQARRGRLRVRDGLRGWIGALCHCHARAPEIEVVPAWLKAGRAVLPASSRPQTGLEHNAHLQSDGRQPDNSGVPGPQGARSAIIPRARGAAIG